MAAIGGALLTSAVTQGVSRIGTALTESARPHTSSVLAERNFQPTEEGLADHPCIQIVRGWFYRNPRDSADKDDTPFHKQVRLVEAATRLDGSFVEPDQLEWFWGNGLWLAGPPEFVFEGVLGQATGDQSARFVYPLYLRMEEPVESRRLRPDKARNVMIFLGFEGADASLDVEKSPGATLKIGRMEPRKTLEFPAPRLLPEGVFMVCADSVATPLAGGSGMPAPTTGGDAAACMNKINAVAPPFESDWFKLQLGNAPSPLRLKALVTETQGASEFLGFVAAVFAGAQPTIQTELDALVNPVTRARREAEAQKAEETARDTLDASLAGAIKGLQDCAGGTADLPDLASKARKAVRDYDAARRALGDGPVFRDGDFKAIPIAGNAAEIKSGCAMALDKLVG